MQILFREALTLGDAAQIPAIFLRVLEKRHEVADADDINRGGQAIVVMGHARQHHVAAIDRDAILVKLRLLRNPIEQRQDGWKNALFKKTPKLF